MKKSIQIIATVLVMLFGNSAVGQNDTMYVMRNGVVTHTISLDSNHVDSIIFYKPIIGVQGNGVNDIDGNTYQSVIIGTQEWMVENLRTSKYSDSTAIPNVTGDTEWGGLTTGAWCHYDNDSSQYEAMYGKLYNWYAVETGKLCPTGWHVPTDAEWYVLTNYVASDGHNGEEGKALKSTSGWNDGGSGTDVYGWNGLPSGSWTEDGFSSIGYYDNWWSSSQHDSVDAWIRYISAYSDLAGRIAYNKNYGFSVRCLRD
jgi:uncharacterized protein (TIGR02145 family)